MSTDEKAQAVQAFVMHHLVDSDRWPILPFLDIPLPAPLTLHGAMVILSALIVVLLFTVLYRRKAPVPHGLTNLLETFVVFIRDQICVPNLGEHDGRRMAPLLCSLFFFILVMNLVGLVPLFAAATGDVNVTAALAGITLATMVFGAILRNGVLGFLKAFVPHGVPWPLLILLAPLEFVSMFIKAFALTIRLFANMLAGHIVIFSLLGLVVIFGLAGLPSIGLALMIYLLEVGVSFLQAYIFTMLSAMFIGQVYHPAH